MPPRRAVRRAALTLIVVVCTLAASAAPAEAGNGKGAGGGGAGGCRRKCDTVAPSLTIADPAAGSTVTDAVWVTGSATDSVGVTAVSVAVDGGPWTAAAGTTAWSIELNARGWAPGSHVISARAVDAAGNNATQSREVTVPEPAPADEPPPPDDPPSAPVLATQIVDPSAVSSLYSLGRTRLAQWDDVVGVLFGENLTNRRAMQFRDLGDGTSSIVDLPVDSLQGWGSAATVMTSATDLWILGGNGPLVLRHYRLSGSPLPSSASLVERRTLGDTDSRAGDLLDLASGGLVAAWHQQGATGPQGQYVAYRSPTGTWTTPPALQFMVTHSSDQVLAQHPADGSVWLFSNPDAWGAIGAVHLSETGGGLVVDWTNSTLISASKHDTNGPDPENPDLAVATDPVTGTIALAYQSGDRHYVSDGARLIAESRVAVARITAGGALGFIHTPTYTERVSDIGVIVHGGDTWVLSRPVDIETLTWDRLHAARHRNGTWDLDRDLGVVTPDEVTYAPEGPVVRLTASDWTLHVVSLT